MQPKRTITSLPDPDRRKALSALPAVSRVQGSSAYGKLAREVGSALATDLLRAEISRLREEILRGSLDAPALRRAGSAATLVERARSAAWALLAPSPRVVINATGVIVHTNLGRSVLSEAAARRLAEASTAYMDLEYDLAGGHRGNRGSHLDPLWSRLFPAHATAVFNNNAAAILVALRALSRGREVVVSRGELVEIGGSFRIPDILAASGARLREVGTTNRTRVLDYEQALTSRTGILLKVHTSNFRIVGFTEEATVASLAGLARTAGLPLVVDWGSGDLVDLAPLGIKDEIPIRRILDDGADLVTFSGDKLLGGPQAGIAVGRQDLVTRLKKDPLARVCRLDRLQIVAMRETLSSYVRGKAFEEIPTLRMLRLTPQEIGRRADAMRREVARRARASDRLRVVDGISRTGGGSSPVGERRTRLLAVDGKGGDAGGIERALRHGAPPVVGRLHEGKLLLDLRTVLPSQDRILAERLADALREEAPAPARRIKR